MADVVLIENKEKRILGPPSAPGHTHLMLKPGINRVPVEAWAYAKKYKFVKSRLNDTLFEVGTTKDEAKGVPGSDVLKALEIVKGTLDLELLREWQETEKRKKVVASIDRQIEIMEAGRRGDDKKEGDDGGAADQS